MTSDRVVEQSLHGYAEGHSLLASSLDFGREVRRVLLEMSDISGRALPPGFEAYITGYPVPGTSLYALAKTWAAPELPRPGCVWTQTLYVQRGFLSTLPSLAWLAALFVRPQASRESWAAYGQSLHCQPPIEGEDLLRNTPLVDRRTAQAILESFYARDTRPLLLPSRAAVDYEAFVFQLWEQQWPSLRTEFHFCTGSLSPRTLLSKDFDLQVVPTTMSRVDRRKVRDAVVVDRDAAPNRVTDWSWRATSDLGQPSHELRGFVWRHARGARREQFPALVELWEPGVSVDFTPSSLVQSVTARYPTPEDAPDLKAWLLAGVKDSLTSLCPQSTFAELIDAVVSFESGSFSVAPRDLNEAAQLLWAQAPSRAGLIAQRLLQAPSVSPFGERFASSLLETVSAQNALGLAEGNSRLVGALAAKRPDLLHLPAFWHLREDVLRDAFQSGWPFVIEGDGQARTINAMLDARSDAAAKDVLAAWGTGAVAMALDWFDSSDDRTTEDFPAGWCAAMRPYGPSVLDFLERDPAPRQATFALAAHVVDVRQSDVRGRGVAPWLREHSAVPSPLSRESLLRLRSFQFALGLSLLGPGAEQLIARAFPEIHEALKQGDLSFGSWTMLEPLVPQLSWRRNWDKCERVRRVVMTTFARQGWSLQYLLSCVHQPALISALISSGVNGENGPTVASWLRRSINEVLPTTRRLIEDLL